MDAAEKDRIIKKLEEVHAINPCPRCGNGDFVIGDGYGAVTFGKQVGDIDFSRVVSTIATFCTKCGFLSQHVLGILGLLPEETEAEE